MQAAAEMAGLAVQLYSSSVRSSFAEMHCLAVAAVLAAAASFVESVTRTVSSPAGFEWSTPISAPCQSFWRQQVTRNYSTRWRVAASSAAAGSA